jgi:hypothetical protein
MKQVAELVQKIDNNNEKGHLLLGKRAGNK